MHRTFFSEKGGYVQEYTGTGGPRLVPFPVCLAIKFGSGVSEECPDFILNMEKSRVFVRTATPLPEGSSLLMHFYIPPENKLLAEIRGEVLSSNSDDPDYPKGMLIKFGFFSHGELSNLTRYLEGEKHLLNITA